MRDSSQCSDALYRPWTIRCGNWWCELIDHDGRLGHCHTSRAYVVTITEPMECEFLNTGGIPPSPKS